jgi:hypothetical protein
MTKKGWIPTHKWIAAQVVALAGIATSAIDSGWDATETKLCIAWAVQAGVTYLLPNDSAPGGVPDAKVVAR